MKPKDIRIDLIFLLLADITKNINNLLALGNLLPENKNIKLLFIDNIILVKNNKYLLTLL